MTLPYPPGLGYGRIKARLAVGLEDKRDNDSAPDLEPATRLQVTFTPTVSMIRFTGEKPLVIFPEPVIATVGTDGVLRSPDGSADVVLLATEGDSISPSGWTWKVEITSADEEVAPEFHICLPHGAVVDLSTAAPVDQLSGVVKVADASLMSQLQAVLTKASVISSEISAHAKNVQTADSQIQKTAKLFAEGFEEVSTLSKQAEKAKESAERARSSIQTSVGLARESLVGAQKAQTAAQSAASQVREDREVIKRSLAAFTDFAAVPVGTIVPYAGATAPQGWLLCDGRRYSMEEKYGNLAVVLNQMGDSLTVPDLRARSGGR